MTTTITILAANEAFRLRYLDSLRYFCEPNDNRCALSLRAGRREGGREECVKEGEGRGREGRNRIRVEWSAQTDSQLTTKTTENVWG